MKNETASHEEDLAPTASEGRCESARLSPEDVVAAHADLVHGLARRLARNEDEARDLFQESFVKILRGLPAFEERSSLRTWICQIVINTDRNRRRWWSRLRRNLPAVSADVSPGEEAPPRPILDPAPDPERVALGREARARLEASLRELPPEQRLAVVLRDVEGLSYDEIAAAMGIAVGTVKSRIARARAVLRERLADLVDAPAGGRP